MYNVSKRLKQQTRRPSRRRRTRQLRVVLASPGLQGGRPRPPTMSGAPAEAPPPAEVVCLLDSDDEDDVVVVCDVRGAVAPAAPLALQRGCEDVVEVGGDDAGDLVVVGVVQTAPVLPHERRNCRAHVFFAQVTDAAHAQNMRKCSMCYCYVCETEASLCRAWQAHCMASGDVVAWEAVRTRYRAAGTAGSAIDVPSVLLPPKLRPRHLREYCEVYAFKRHNSDRAQRQNMRRCDKCMCFLCQREAATCGAWDAHCMATEKQAVWHNLRKVRGVEPGEAVVVPSLMLPPKLLRARRAQVASRGKH